MSSTDPPPVTAELTIDGSGTRWPDQIYYPASPIKLFKKSVCDTILDHGLTGIELYPLEVKRSWVKKLPVESAPEYCWGRIVGRAQAKLISQETGEELPKKESGVYDLSGSLGTLSWALVDENEWDGSDFFYLTTLDSGYRFCTERFVDLVKKMKWTNINFYGPYEDGRLVI